MRKLIKIAFALSVTLGSCLPAPTKHNYIVHQYKQKRTDSSDDLVYWYIIFGNDGSTGYYYSSPTPVTNFRDVNFTYAASGTRPPVDVKELEEEQELNVDEELLPEQLEQELDANEAEFSEAEVDASDGGTVAEEADNSADSDASDSGDDSGGDSGGDGGGGDGGGGE